MQTTRGALKILVADDNVDVAESLGMLLRAWGHEVTIAFDGEQAVEAARIQVPDVVLMDLLMPHVDGIDATRMLREQPWGSQIVIIAISAWARHFERSRFDAVGFDHRLVKPIEPAALAALLPS